MKITYEKNILEKLDEAIRQASLENKRIQEIELEPTESHLFRTEARRAQFTGVVPRVGLGQRWPREMTYRGITIHLDCADDDF